MYSRNNFRKRLDQLQQQFPENISQLAHLKDRLIITYTKCTLEVLAELLRSTDNDRSLAQKIKIFLNEQWTQINGTMLAYTALPNHDLTQFLCDLAEWAADQLNAEPHHNETHSALKLLMPTVNIVSIHNDYPDLGPTEETPNQNNINLSTMLHTHLLGRHGAYLVPISLLTTLDANPNSQITFNPYYDFEQHDEALVRLSAEEVSRLFNHSQLTHALRDTLNQLQTLLNENSHLLGQLRLLCAQLDLNNVTGSGTEENAGKGAYPAIIAFNNYYNQLDDTQKSNIPTAVKKQIDLIRKLASDPTENVNATENLATCIAVRRTKLLDVMKENEDALIQISTTEQKKTELADKAKKDFDGAQEQLKTALQANESDKQGYLDGYDRLGISRRLLSHFKVDIQFNSDADLVLLHPLSPEEIKELCSDASIAQKIIRRLGSVENLVIFFLELSSKQLTAFMETLLDQGLFDLIGAPRDFSAFLITQRVERVEIICQSLDGKLRDIIKDASCFNSVIKHLSTAQCTAVCEALGNHLTEIIRSARDFLLALWCLNTAQCAAVCNALKDHLPTIIKSCRDFGQALRHLSTAQCTAVCDALGNHLPEIIKSARAFWWALTYLNTEQRTVVYEALKAHLPTIINSAENFGAALEFLSTAQGIAVCDALKARLPKIIESAFDFGVAIKCLSTERRAVVYEALKAHLPTIIESADDVWLTLEHLSTAQCTDVCEALKNHLPTIIKSTYNFRQAISYLNTEQRTVVYETLKAHLLTIINSSEKLGRALTYLSTAQCTAVCDALKERLPTIIQSADDFWLALHDLDTEQRSVVYEALKARLPIIIKSRRDFREAFEHLSAKQKQEAKMLIASYKYLRSSNRPADTQQSLLLQYVDGLERANLEVIIIAMRSNPNSYQFLPDYLKNNDTVFKLSENTSDKRFGLPTKKNRNLYNQIQTICFLQRYVELREKEQSVHWPRRIFSLFHHNNAYDSETKCSAAQKCISILQNKSTEPLTAKEKEALSDGRLHCIIENAQEKLYNASIQPMRLAC